MTLRRLSVVAVLFLGTAAASPTPVGAVSPDTKVSVSSPPTPYIPNSSNEPAVAMDAHQPAILAAGANDPVDSAPCNGTRSALPPDTGISGIYVSLDSGTTWVQPTYTGLTAQS